MSSEQSIVTKTFQDDFNEIKSRFGIIFRSQREYLTQDDFFHKEFVFGFRSHVNNEEIEHKTTVSEIKLFKQNLGIWYLGFIREFDPTYKGFGLRLRYIKDDLFFIDSTTQTENYIMRRYNRLMVIQYPTKRHLNYVKYNDPKIGTCTIGGMHQLHNL